MEAATAKAMREHQKERHETRLNMRIDEFIRRHKPADPQKADEFHGDLMMLMRELHMDAQAPANETIKNILSNHLMSWPSVMKP